MIKLTNECFENGQFIDSIKKIYINDRLSIVNTYKFSVFYKELEKRNIAYSEVKDKLIIRYGKQEDDKFIIPKEKAEEYTNEFNALLKEEFTINVEKIPFDSNMLLSPADLIALEEVINFEDI